MRSLTVFINAGPWLPVPPSGYGGVENLLVYLIKELRRRDHRVILGTVADSRIDVDERVVRFEEGRHRHMAEPFYEAMHVTHGHMDKVLDVIADMPEIDVVHDFLEIVGPSMLARLGPGGPPVLHTLQWNLAAHADYYDHFNGHGRVLFNGISEPQMRAAPGNLRKQSLGVVHNSVDLKDFALQPEKEDYVITLARFTRDKGQDIAARICEELGLNLRMAGTVGGISSKELLHKELDSDPTSPLHYYRDVQYYQQVESDHPRAVWVGNLGGEAKKKLVADARALLMPIRWEEPFGMAVIEALASGTPVVAMRRGAMPVIIDHGYNGFLADDEEQFKHYLERVDEIQPENCRRSVEKNFSAAEMVDRYLDRYEEVLERAPHRGRRRRRLPWRFSRPANLHKAPDPA
jgi:glycosyltransferase involved in cell wall biosynthesis